MKPAGSIKKIFQAEFAGNKNKGLLDCDTLAVRLGLRLVVTVGRGGDSDPGVKGSDASE